MKAFTKPTARFLGALGAAAILLTAVGASATQSSRVRAPAQTSGVAQPARPPAPKLSYFRNITADASIDVVGVALGGATQVRLTTPTGEYIVPVGASGSFTASVALLSNQVNPMLLFSKNPSQVESLPTFIEITQDIQAPTLFIDSHTDGQVVTTATVDVFGRVADSLAGAFGIDVTVNGVSANVDIGLGSNGTYVLADVAVPLNVPLLIEVVAQDLLDNTSTSAITITRVDQTEEYLEVLSGSGQTGTVGGVLPIPLIARVLDSSGAPLLNKLVTFRVDHSDGLIGESPQATTSRRVQVRSDSVTGEVQVYWRLGSDAGSGNNRVIATSTSIPDNAIFVATGEVGAPVQINMGSGSNQRVETGGVAPHPLIVWVNDSCNGFEGASVLYQVVSGGGLVNGQQSVTVMSGETGHAEVLFTAPVTPGISVIEASHFQPGTGMPAQFVIESVAGQPGSMASYRGLVVDNAQQPLVGATCHLVVNDVDMGTVLSDDSGCFEFVGIPEYGDADLTVLGETVSSVLTPVGLAAPLGRYPKLHFDTQVIEGADNELGMAVTLPCLRPVNDRAYSTTEDTLLTVDGHAGLEILVKAGSMYIDGAPAPDGTPLSMNLVHHDDIPMPMPDGVAPLLAWTVQPGGAVFDPPADIRYPNMTGLPAGAAAYFLSFDHAAGKFLIVASASVSEDGSEILSDPGSGLSVAGWGCNCPPYAAITECDGCRSECSAEGEITSTGISVSNMAPAFGEMVIFNLDGFGYSDGRVTKICPPPGGTSVTSVPADSLEASWEITTPVGTKILGTGTMAPLTVDYCGVYECKFTGKATGTCAPSGGIDLGSRSVEFTLPGVGVTTPIFTRTLNFLTVAGIVNFMNAMITPAQLLGASFSLTFPINGDFSTWSVETVAQCCPDQNGMPVVQDLVRFGLGTFDITVVKADAGFNFVPIPAGYFLTAAVNASASLKVNGGATAVADCDGSAGTLCFGGGGEIILNAGGEVGAGFLGFGASAQLYFESVTSASLDICVTPPETNFQFDPQFQVISGDLHAKVSLFTFRVYEQEWPLFGPLASN